MTTTETEKKYPKAIQALLDVLDASRADVAAKAVTDGAAEDVSEEDVSQARILAEIAAEMIPAAPKLTDEQKRLAKAVAKCNSMALAIGDLAAKRAPSTASLSGYKLLSTSSAAKATLATEALGELAQARGMNELDHELDRSACGTGKRGGYVSTGTKGARPAAKAWRILIGAACASGVLTSRQAADLHGALTAQKQTKAA